MNEPTKSQRGKMAAHLTDLAGIAFRSDDPDLGRFFCDEAKWIFKSTQPEVPYRGALRVAHLAPEDIDAAVASCMQDEHPAGSLPARVADMQKYADSSSEANALGSVLGMLGVKS